MAPTNDKPSLHLSHAVTPNIDIYMIDNTYDIYLSAFYDR